MTLFNNYIPASYLTQKTAQVIPEQFITESVDVYEVAVPYIKCELQSTIQHEGAHRKDEERRDQEHIELGRDRSRSRSRAAQVIPFSEFSSESRTEPIAESEEESCMALYPHETSGETVSVNLNQLFEDAKSAARIDRTYKRDIKAGTLDPRAQGMYLMQNMPEAVAVEPGSNPNQYHGFDGTLWIDVRKIVEPFMVETIQESFTEPATFQDDGIHPDLPNVSKTPPAENAVPASPYTPAVPEVQAR